MVGRKGHTKKGVEITQHTWNAAYKSNYINNKQYEVRSVTHILYSHKVSSN